jgi:hypothetical protein
VITGKQKQGECPVDELRDRGSGGGCQIPLPHPEARAPASLEGLPDSGAALRGITNALLKIGSLGKAKKADLSTDINHRYNSFQFKQTNRTKTQNHNLNY